MADAAEQPLRPTAAGSVRQDGTNPRNDRVPRLIKTVLLLICTALLVAACVNFRGKWGDACDYHRRVWVVVLLGRMIFQGICVTFEKYFPRVLGVILPLTDIFGLAWFLYGIKAVLVDPYCDINAYRWALALWIVQCIVTILPALLFVIMLLVICCLVLGGATLPSDSQPNPTPPDVVSKLEVVNYRDVKDILTNQPQVVAPAPDRSAEISSIAQVAGSLGNIAGIPVPERQFRRMGTGRMPSRSNTGLAVNATPDESTASASNASPKAEAKGNAGGGLENHPSCPICCCDFEEDDKLTLMPCDRRHAFHQDCVAGWLEKSRLCAICRADVVDLVNKKSTENVTVTTDETKAKSEASAEV